MANAHPYVSSGRAEGGGESAKLEETFAREMKWD